MLRFAEETFDQFYNDALPLFTKHYEELALDRDKVKLELDTLRYRQAEQDGVLHIATMRVEGQLVGYFVSALMRHLHYASLLCASTDMYWVKPEYRKHGARFIAYVEKCWRKRGVKKAYVSCKVHLDKQAFYEAMGYRFSDKMFVKML